MKRSLIVLGTFLVALYLGSVPASAQRGNRPTSPGMSGASHGPSSHDSSNTAGGSSTETASSPSSVFAHSPNLATHLTNALIKSGVFPSGTTSSTLISDCTSGTGFRTLGQCIAALHVSHNLGGNCTFTALKTSLATESLGKAIQGCDPHADAKAEASKGMKQANAEVKNAKS